MPAGLTLQGKTLGVYGLGGIGSIVASIGSVLGMKVIVCGRESTVEKAAAMGYEVVTKEKLFETADVLTLHLRFNARTAGIVTGSDLARMKAGALFVNTSRAELLEPGALVSALRKGRPSRAALDVFEQEPLPAGHPLRGMPNVLLTPHLGYVTDGALEQYYDEVVKEFLANV
jgi:D-3-phosphoglycerate dehydrogenase